MDLPDQLPQFGYLYHYPQLDHPMGAFQLDVYLQASPGSHHFEPKALNLAIKNEDGFIERLVLRHHPGEPDRTYPVVAGRVEIIDQLDHKKQAFTFGGHLQVSPQEHATVCILNSPAPIIGISEAAPQKDLLIEEFEVLLAERQAALEAKPGLFEHKLVNADPWQLYWALSRTLAEKLDQPEYHQSEAWVRVLAMLRQEEQRLKRLRIVKGYTLPLEKVL